MAQAALDTAALAGFSGELLRDGDQGYDDARTVFNASIDRRPALIARCAGVADVMDALAFAREQGLDVSVKGGGHSVSGHAVVHETGSAATRPCGDGRRGGGLGGVAGGCARAPRSG